MKGIFKWYNNQLQEKIKDKPEQYKLRMIKNHKTTYNTLIESAGIPKNRWDTPFTAYDKDPDIDLANPYGKIVGFVLYLYSLEFGDPPLYADLNKAARAFDTSKLEELGP